jgi:hypothetical protein
MGEVALTGVDGTGVALNGVDGTGVALNRVDGTGVALNGHRIVVFVCRNKSKE